MSQDEEWASSSVTSIGTEENSLGALRARSRALYIHESHQTESKGVLQVQRGRSQQ